MLANKMPKKSGKSASFRGNKPSKKITSKNSGKQETEDRRIRRTKTLLKKALIELIVEKGFENIRVEDIINRADVGRTSFYSHFKSKEDLLLQNLDDLENLFSPSSGESEVPGDFSLYLFIHLKENWKLARALMGNKKIPVVRNHVQGIILKSYKKRYEKEWGTHRAKEEIEAASVFSSGALVSMILWWLSQSSPLSPEKMHELFSEFNAVFSS